MRSDGERPVGIAIFDDGPRHQIIRAIKPCLWRARRQSGPGVIHDRQDIVSQLQQPDSVLGDSSAFRNDNRHRLTDIADLVIGEARRINIKTNGRRLQRQRHTVTGQPRTQISMRENRAYTRQRPRRLRADTEKPRMRDRAAQESRMQQPRQDEIIEKTRPAPEQPFILHPQ